MRVVRLQTLPGGQVRRLEQTSNETPFTITPFIEEIGELDEFARFTVTGALFQHADPPIEGDDVQVLIGAEGLRRQDQPPDTGLGRGEFQVVSAEELRICLPEELEGGPHFPLRVRVNGAESAPDWIEVP